MLEARLLMSSQTKKGIGHDDSFNFVLEIIGGRCGVVSGFIICVGEIMKTFAFGVLGFYAAYLIFHLILWGLQIRL